MGMFAIVWFLFAVDCPGEEHVQVERQLEERVAPIIRRVFSYTVWLSLADS